MRTVFSLRILVLLWLLPFISGMFFPSHCRADLVDLLEISVFVPERDVSINYDSPVIWKKYWDEARYLARTGDFSGAKSKYEELLRLKGNLELARWEYGRLLLKTGNWLKASATIEWLVEKEPDCVVYLNGLALAMRKLGQFGRALDLFKKAHENDLTNLTALAGLAQGLVEGGHKKEAFPLFEEIYFLRPDDSSIHRSLASLAFELGKLETARKLMAPLAECKDADLDTLLMMARIYEELGQDKAATIYWERCLVHDPDNREARGRLALYYEKIGGGDKAMPHLLALLEKDPLNASLLSRICRFYIQADKFAEALPYFERYVLLRPDNLDDLMPVGNDIVDPGDDAISLYRRLLAVTPDDLELLDGLANDLLKAGDPEAALFMWEHVARLYPDRVEVYQEIVDLLERLGRDKKLVEVLEVLHRLAPGEIKVVSKLANLKVAQGDLQVGLEYYNKLETAGYNRADLFEGRGSLYEDLGRLALALANYKKLLEMHPHRHDIRRRSIKLAGKLGENLFLREQVLLLDAVKETANRDEDLLLVARAFADANDFDQSLIRYQKLIISRTEASINQNTADKFDSLKREAKLGIADLYLREGLVFESEQILREIYLAGEGQGVVLERLFYLTLENNNYKDEDAEIWLNKHYLLNGVTLAGVLMRARFLAAAGDYDEVENFLGNFMHDSLTGDYSSSFENKKAGIMRQVGLLLAEVFIEDEDLEKAERQCLAMLRSEQDNEVLVLLLKIYDLDGREEAAKNIFKKLLSEADDAFKLLGLARLLGKYELITSQISIADKVLASAPDSLAAAFFKADGLAATGNTLASIKLLESMARIYPENSAITIRMAKYNYSLGQYALALQHCDRFLERNPRRFDAHFLKSQCISALGDNKYVETLFGRLFPIETGKILKRNIKDAGIKFTLPPIKKTIFQLLTFSSGGSLSLVEELMGPRHVIDDSTNDKKKLNLIAVSLYAQYRWELEFRKL